MLQESNRSLNPSRWVFKQAVMYCFRAGEGVEAFIYLIARYTQRDLISRFNAQILDDNRVKM